MNDVPLNIVVHCPKCSAEWRTSEPITQFDCLSCGARIVSEERERPALRVVSREDRGPK